VDEEDRQTMTIEIENLSTIRAYLTALQDGLVGEALARFFTPDAVQVELPNKLNPNGGRSDLPTLLKRAEQGQKLLRTQSYVVQTEIAEGDRVAVEAIWSATLAVPLGSLIAGAIMRAHFAMFFELREGRICSQRNYDCFEPW
jgi:ketosteroid isomerase-like protein